MSDEQRETPVAAAGHLSLRYWFVVLAIASLFCSYIAFRYRALPAEGRPTMLLWLGVALFVGGSSFALQLWNMARQCNCLVQAGERIAISKTTLGNKWSLVMIVLLIPCALLCVSLIVQSAEPEPQGAMSFVKTYNLILFSALTGINLVTLPTLLRSLNRPVAVHEHGLVGLGLTNWKWYRSYRIEVGGDESTLHLKLWHAVFSNRLKLANEHMPAVISVLERNGITCER